ncbi:MAG: aminopeptidase P family protein, partial [Deltaproteobacteria bacterium]|nr:aminopeptidase P family protein [Deltaproteobacteria bacterium]
MKKDTLLIIDTTENNADLLYRTNFFVPDPVIYIEHNGEKILVLSDLEIDRGKNEATVDTILSLSEYQKRLLSKRRKRLGFVDIADEVLKDQRIKKALVPTMFSIKYADELRKRGYTIKVSEEAPFFKERLKKTPQEINSVKDALRKTARAMDLAIRLVASSEIRRNKLYMNGQVLTSEKVKGEISAEL